MENIQSKTMQFPKDVQCSISISYQCLGPRASSRHWLLLFKVRISDFNNKYGGHNIHVQKVTLVKPQSSLRFFYPQDYTSHAQLQ